MKKRLLMVAFALLSAATSFAYVSGDYAYNSTQRFKITGDNEVTNGIFASGLDGWLSADGETAPSAEYFSVTQGAGPAGENVIESVGASVGQAICNKWALEAGTYIVSFDIKSPNAGNTSIIEAGKDPSSTAIDFFLNTTGSVTKEASTDEAPVINVASSVSFPTDEWKNIVFYLTAEDGQNLVMRFENLPAGIQFTNIEIHKAQEVYDIRIAQNRINFIKTLMELPDFNTEESQGPKEALQGTIETVESMIAAGEFDDPSNAEGIMAELENGEDGSVAAFMSVTARRMNDKLAGTEDVVSLPTIGRGGARGKEFANLDLWGGNWGHTAGADYLMSAIQNSFANSGTYTVFNTNFPKGRYLFTAEIRNANTGKGSWPCVPTFNLETVCKVFVGTDSAETEPIAGEEYQRVLRIADIAEDGQFRAGVEWPGTGSGGAFFVKNVEVYALGKAEDVEASVNHIEAWVAFKTQWDAATNNCNTLSEKLGNPNYPWEQDSVKTALTQWNALYNDIVAKGWVADGKDAGVATTEELVEWTTHQGFYPTVEEGADSTYYNRYIQYAVVRGYQDANNWVVNANKPFTDLGNAIEDAKKTRNNGANLTGDRETYKAAILAALNTLTTVRSTTTDATREADTQTLTDALATLTAATEAFLATVTTAPVVDIDFSNNFEEAFDEEGNSVGYVIKGVAGQMEFPTGVVDLEHGDGADPKGSQWSLGFGEEYLDVLRIGSTAATINIPGEIKEGDAVTVSFDFWGGYLNKCYTKFELQNAAGESLAEVIRYNSQGTSSSTFGVGQADLDKYITVTGSSSKQNAGIYTDANNKSSITMVMDYKNNTKQLTLVQAKAGTFEGAPVELTTPESGDNKVAKLVIVSNYSSQKNSPRRSWLDNIKITKYTLTDLEEDITEPTWAEVVGIQGVTAEKQADNAIYTLSGVKVSKATKPGLYIQNGKKFIVK